MVDILDIIIVDHFEMFSPFKNVSFKKFVAITEGTQYIYYFLLLYFLVILF